MQPGKHPPTGRILLPRPLYPAEMAGMVSAIDHINIVVTDLDRSVRFYTEILGMKETQRAELSGEWIETIVGLEGVRAEVAFVVAPAGEPRIELICYRTPAGQTLSANAVANTIGLRHIAFRVDDIAAAVAKLKRHSVPILSEPVGVPNSVVTHAAGEKKLCYFHDPDGVLLELSQYTHPG